MNFANDSMFTVRGKIVYFLPEHTMLDLEGEFGLEEVPRPVFLTQRGFVRPGLNLARKDWKVEDGEDEFHFDPPIPGPCLWQQT